jgi:hypothetical protein
MPHMRRSVTLLLASVFVAACDPQPTTGSLVVNMSGLPSGGEGAVRISGPNQFYQVVRATTTVENLQAGRYAVIRDTVTIANSRYGVALVRDSVTIERGRSASTAAAYALSSGSIALNVFGLPDNVVSTVRVRGPLPVNTYNQVHPATTTINGLVPGQYDIIADSLTSFLGDRFSGAPLTQSVTVAASETPVPANVAYQLISGTLALTVNGLPASNAVQAVTVTGPNGYLQRAAQSQTLRGMTAGTYNVAATNITGTCPNIYKTTDESQNVTVSVGTMTNATVTYAVGPADPADLDLKVDKIILTQATQNAAGSVPIITGKPALVRVFGSANQCNAVKPTVRITTSTGFVQLIEAQEDSVRLAPDERQLSATWNAVIPAEKIQVGMTVFAEIDANQGVNEANENDNRFPSSGSQLIDVRSGPVVRVRFVPILQSRINTTGEINASLGDAFLDLARRLHPVGTYEFDIHDVFTATTDTLQAPGANWTQMLNEIRLLQIAEGTDRYYYGVAKVRYSSGVAGIGYVPGHAAMGWDYLTSGPSIMAHELGHNFNRGHAPCPPSGPGAPLGIDQQYPVANGRIGSLGWEPGQGLKAGDLYTDLMGYCDPRWISDYTYKGMLDWLLAHPSSASSVTTPGAAQPSLLIWGRIENGRVVLEPAFAITARAQQIVPGPHRVTALDENGGEIFGISFAGERIADLPGENETFAFSLPLSALRGRTIASLKLIARGRTVTNVASSNVAADPSVVVTRVNARAARIRWDATRFPVVMVRDPDTGMVLSFARGGDATIATSKAALDLNFSNRVSSSRRYREFK